MPEPAPRPTPAVATRAVAITGIGIVFYVIAVMAAYFAMPVAEYSVATVWQAVGLAILAVSALLVAFVAGLRRVRGARLPLLRAIFLVAVLVATYIVVFAYVYLSLEARGPGQIMGLDTHLDGVYFTVTMLTTVGFGDISPTGQIARGVATVQMVFNVVLLGAVVRSAVQVGRSERQRQQSSFSDDAAGR